jgi:hypothetical protein
MKENQTPATYEELAAELGRIGGFAPGRYHCKCTECKRFFIGDKRACMCLGCAIKLQLGELQHKERRADRTMTYMGRSFLVQEGFSHRISFVLDLPPELHLTTDNIFEVLEAIERVNSEQGGRG